MVREGSASSQTEQELAVSMLQEAPLAADLMRGLQFWLSGKAALAADLIRSSQFYLAGEAALPANLMRSTQFQGSADFIARFYSEIL